MKLKPLHYDPEFECSTCRHCDLPSCNDDSEYCYAPQDDDDDDDQDYVRVVSLFDATGRIAIVSEKVL